MDKNRYQCASSVLPSSRGWNIARRPRLQRLPFIMLETRALHYHFHDVPCRQNCTRSSLKSFQPLSTIAFMSHPKKRDIDKAESLRHSRVYTCRLLRSEGEQRNETEDCYYTSPLNVHILIVLGCRGVGLTSQTIPEPDATQVSSATTHASSDISYPSSPHPSWSSKVSWSTARYQYSAFSRSSHWTLLC